MSESRFIIDISFLGLLIRSIRSNQINISDEVKATEKSFKKNILAGINSVFDLIKTRNFKECAIDPRYYIFAHNEDDDKIDIRDSPRLNEYFNSQAITREDDKNAANDNLGDSITYTRNLQASTDAFQENEMQDVLAHEQRQNRFKQANDVEQK